MAFHKLFPSCDKILSRRILDERVFCLLSKPVGILDFHVSDIEYRIVSPKQAKGLIRHKFVPQGTNLCPGTNEAQIFVPRHKFRHKFSGSNSAVNENLRRMHHTKISLPWPRSV